MGRKPKSKTTNMSGDKQTWWEKKEVRLRYRHGQRRALAISDYLLLAAPQQHMEATEFVTKLEEKYPNKKDVRKTQEFRDWQRIQLGLLNNKTSRATDKPVDIKDMKDSTTPADIEHGTASKKEMILRIPLLDINPKEAPPVAAMPGEEEQLINIFNEIPPNVMNQIMEEIRADPILDAILNDFDVYEEIIDEGNVFDLDMDIDVGFPLEEELNKLF